MAYCSTSEDAYRMRMQKLDEAFEVAKRGRVLSAEEERKLRRSVSNQLSVRRMRLKKLQYIDEMEKKITQFEETIGNLSPEVQNLKESNTKLGIENSMLEEKLKKWTDYTNSVDAQIEGRKAEIRMLEEYQRMLKMKNIGEANSSTGNHWSESCSFSQLPESGNGDVRQQPESGPEEDIEQYLNLDALYLSNATKSFDT